MRELIITENITIDGVIDASEGWFVPSGSDDEHDAAELAKVQQEHMSGADAVLLGRVTYQEFEDYWPKQADDLRTLRDRPRGRARSQVPDREQHERRGGPLLVRVQRRSRVPGR